MKPYSVYSAAFALLFASYFGVSEGLFAPEVVCTGLWEMLEGQAVFGDPFVALTGCFLVILNCAPKSKRGVAEENRGFSLLVPVYLKQELKNQVAHAQHPVHKEKRQVPAAFHCFSESMIISPARTQSCKVAVILPGGKGDCAVHFDSAATSFENIVDIDIVGEITYSCIELGVGTETVHISGKCLKGTQTMEKLKSIAGIGKEEKKEGA